MIFMHRKKILTPLPAKLGSCAKKEKGVRRCDHVLTSGASFSLAAGSTIVSVAV
jgi:hypothetical protein